MTGTVSVWCGTPVDQLEKPELLDALSWCGKEIERLQTENQKLAASCDWGKYLLQGEAK